MLFLFRFRPHDVFDNGYHLTHYWVHSKLYNKTTHYINPTGCKTFSPKTDAFDLKANSHGMFCTYGKKHIWKKAHMFSVHTICREHICSDIPCHLPGILYHHKFYVPTHLSTHIFCIPTNLGTHKIQILRTCTNNFQIPTNLSTCKLKILNTHTNLFRSHQLCTHNFE